MIDANQILEDFAEGLSVGYAWAVAICVGIAAVLLGTTGVLIFYILKWAHVIH